MIKIPSDFGAARSVGFTVPKFLEAVRQLGGYADLLVLSEYSMQHLASQITGAMCPTWEYGAVTSFMGVPVKRYEGQGNAYVYYGDLMAEIECA